MTTDLHPMGLGELLDRIVAYYKKYFWTFVGIAVPAEAVLIGVVALAQLMGWRSTTTFGSGPPGPEQVAAVFGILAVFAAIYFFGVLAHIMAMAAASSAVAKIQNGERVTVAAAYGTVKGRIGHLIGLFGLFIAIGIGAYLVLTVVVVFALLLGGLVSAASGMSATGKQVLLGITAVIFMLVGIVLAIWFMLRYALAIPALMIEKLGPGQALGRSSRLAKGGVGRIFLAVLLVYLLLAIFGIVFQAPFWVAGALIGFKFQHYPTWLTILALLGSGVGAVVGYPGPLIALPLLYFDARVRKEGYDLQVMMSALGPAAGQAPAETEPPPQQLNSVSLVLMVVFYLITLGLYSPLWYLMRVGAINRLNSREKLEPWMAFIPLLVQLAALVVCVVFREAGTLPPMMALAALGLGVTAAALLVLEAFKVRRILESHVDAQRGKAGMFIQRVSLNGAATLIFGVFYLQYKIDELFEEIYPAEAVPGDTAPPNAAGPLPVAPIS